MVWEGRSREAPPYPDHWPIAAPTRSLAKGPLLEKFRSPCYAADNSIGSTIEGSSFSGLLTRVEIGHIRIGSAGSGRIKS